VGLYFSTTNPDNREISREKTLHENVFNFLPNKQLQADKNRPGAWNKALAGQPGFLMNIVLAFR
jgi:hypothetical protein